MLLSIGDISVTQTQVHVPQGRFPVQGTTWAVQDSTQVTESIPAVAIILTIVFVWFCLIGLLFLLMKERRYTGFVTITVTGMGLYHSVQFPSAQHTGAWAADMVGRARAIAASPYAM
ncbi:hypothetical protein FB559_2343 [Actinoallomurus bryophytorum]|uniref:Uncharacterized protein n=1 Tax=Actinoallomurus bryophytorum TaxID=1490222 RepID=A0A543CID3_9ACTN|nr:hypothetical protein [Actinoallomurus bryophytorum]TQL96790.1 hypothetical protein FB559_2343 [Actinoallomurus bryophytorum]